MKKNAVVAMIVILLAVGGLWYINSTKTQPAPAESTDQVIQEVSSTPVTASPAVISDTPAKMDTNVKEITVEGSEFKFSPATLTLKKGEKVRLVFKNTGKMPHDFVVDELGVKTKTISPGAEDTVEFTPDKVGSFESYCSIGQHRANGMVGKVTVTQ